MCPRINLVDPASNQIIFIIIWKTSGCLPEITVNNTPKRIIPRNWYTLRLCVVPLRLFVIMSNPPFLTKLEKKSCALGQIELDILVAPRLTELNPHMRSSRGGWVIAREICVGDGTP